MLVLVEVDVVSDIYKKKRGSGCGRRSPARGSVIPRSASYSVAYLSLLRLTWSPIAKWHQPLHILGPDMYIFQRKIFVSQSIEFLKKKICLSRVVVRMFTMDETKCAIIDQSRTLESSH